MSDSMPGQLKISLGQFSDKGRKETNQDFHGAYVPNEPLLSSKGVAVALADGVSSSTVSHVASEASVSGFLEDYFCTSEALSVKKAARQVLMATNSWLHSQTQQSQYRYELEKGFVCTLSALVLKGVTAHVFHVGDARVYRLREGTLEQLTIDHRHWSSQQVSHLARALGMSPQLEVDYVALSVEVGDVYLLMTDGVHGHLSTEAMLAAVRELPADLNAAAKRLVDEALRNGSDDNLTAQILRVEQLPEREAEEVYQRVIELPFPPELAARSVIDGFTILRELHASARSHVYLAVDGETGSSVVLKTPATDLKTDREHLERFLLEEWIARRISNAHVLKPCAQTRKRTSLYVVMEYLEGQTLAQWLIDNPKPDLQAVRGIIEQIANGLGAFHRLEMLHQDLRPANVMIDRTGTVKIIDFGSTRVAGLDEGSTAQRDQLLGTEQYMAPEYFLGEPGTTRSDLYSLAAIAYQMLSGRLPYGAEVAKSRTRAAQRTLTLRSVLDEDRDIPSWIDAVLKKALHPDPLKRYEELSEFVFDLRRPNREFLTRTEPALLERNPLAFWKGVSFILLVVVVVLAIKLAA